MFSKILTATAIVYTTITTIITIIIIPTTTITTTFGFLVILDKSGKKA